MFLDCPESFCNIWKVSRLSEKFLDCLEPLQIVRKDLVLFLKCPYCLESFLMFCNVSRLSGKFQSVRNLSRLSGMFLYCLESFPIIWKVSILTGKFPECLEIFLIVWTVSGLSGKLFYCLESFCVVWPVSILSGKFLDCLEHFQIGIFVEFKDFAFELIADVNMTKDKKAKKCADKTETGVGKLCHIRFLFL